MKRILSNDWAFNDLVDVVIHADSLDVMKSMKSNSIQLIVTSPPYANKRKADYGGIDPECYLDWFKPYATEMFRVLKPNGTFVLNIKESVVNCQRHTYVIELILMLKEMGWLWTEEFMWHKKNCFPGKWPNRFRDSFERCLQFNKNKSFLMNQESVMVPTGNWKNSRLKSLKPKDYKRSSGKSNNLTRIVENWKNRDLVYPSNVIHIATECANVNHSAPFPVELPLWFIKLFSNKEDTVLDPFLGSGTTAIAALREGRKFIGVEKVMKYAQLSCDRINKANKKLE